MALTLQACSGKAIVPDEGILRPEHSPVLEAQPGSRPLRGFVMQNSKKVPLNCLHCHPPLSCLTGRHRGLEAEEKHLSGKVRESSPGGPGGGAAVREPEGHSEAAFHAGLHFSQPSQPQGKLSGMNSSMALLSSHSSACRGVSICLEESLRLPTVHHTVNTLLRCYFI